MIRLAALALVLVLALTTPAVALTTYYVAPNSTTARTGAAATPWTSLDSSAWLTINTRLATDDVTVYFTARKAASDTDETTSASLEINRTDLSTHRLTLDGMSQYNTSDSSPSWLPYAGASRFNITVTGGTAAITTNNDSFTPNLPRNYWTVRGFKAISASPSTLSTQAMMLRNMQHVIVELNDIANTGGDTGSNGLILGPQGGNDTLSQRPFFGTDVTVRNNIMRQSNAEGFYVAGYYCDPIETNCTQTSAVTWTDLVIQNNVIQNVGRTGQGNCIDVKDGTVRLIIQGNVCQQLLPVGNQDSNDASIILESAYIVDGNFVSGFGAGIVLSAFYRNTNGRNGVQIRNNILTANTDPAFGGVGILVAESSIDAAKWQNIQLDNNTVYNNTTGISIPSGLFPAINVTVQNNISAANAGLQLSAYSGAIILHTNNLFWAPSGTLVTDGANSYTAANIATYEATAKAVNPLLVNPTVAAGAAGFKLQQSSAAIGAATGLQSFNDDYGGHPRGSVWDMGAWAFTVGYGPSAPTQLRISRLRFH